MVCSTANPRIHLVPQFHYDVAYWKTTAQYLEQSFPLIDQAIDLLDRCEEYRFMIEQVFLLDAWWKQASGQSRERMTRFAREGRLEAAPGMYVMPDMNHPNAESLYQQIRLGRQWLGEHLNVVPRVCWIADCWGHHAQLPQILRQCGYDYYAFWRCMRPDVKRNDFHWKGLDGSIISTHWLALGYGGVYFPPANHDFSEPWFGLPMARRQSLLALGEQLQRFGPSSSLLIPCGGDFLAPEPTAPAQLQKLRDCPQLAATRFAVPQEVFDEIAWNAQPLVEGEFNSSFQGTFTTNIHIKQLNRHLTHKLTSLEALTVVTNHPMEFDDHWRLLLKQQFHDIICGSLCDGALRDALDELARLQSDLDHSIDSLCPKEAVAALFNPLPFQRTEWVSVNGIDHRVDLPPTGFAAIKKNAESKPTGLDSVPSSFQSDTYLAQINKKGYITSLIVPSTNLELADSGRIPFGSLAVQMDCGDPWLNFKAPLGGGGEQAALTQNQPDPYDPGNDELVSNQPAVPPVDSVRVLDASNDHLIIQQEGDFAFSQTIRLKFTTRIAFRRESPRIEYIMRLQPSGRYYRVRVAFPMPLPDGLIRHEIPCGIQQRPPGEHVAQHWFDYSNESGGLAVLNRGTPSGNVDGGVMLMTLFRSVAMESRVPSADSFAEGVEHIFSYALVPHGPDSDAMIVRHGLAYNVPPIRCRVDQSQIDRGMMTLSPDNVVMDACRWHDSHIFVRLHESIGKSATVRLVPPGWAKSWSLAGAFGEPIGQTHPIDREIRFDLEPFKIQSLLLIR